MAEIWGNVRADDGAALDKKLDELAATVCTDDPRTKTQRRADAIGAWSHGESSLACECGSDQCSAASDKPDQRPGGVEIQVIAEAATVEGTSDKPGFLPGHGAIPAARVRELAKKARLRPVVIPKDAAAEPQYRPSAGLVRFLRCRDMGCRWPNCSAPAEVCDIDHTTAYPLGPTHPSNCKLYCRLHHLLKTFYCGVVGWNERQLPDGTLILTSPVGRTVTTKPEGARLFPQLGAPTGELIIPNATSPLSPTRGLCMPTRKRSRAQDRAARIEWERGINAARAAANPYRLAHCESQVYPRLARGISQLCTALPKTGATATPAPGRVYSRLFASASALRWPQSCSWRLPRCGPAPAAGRPTTRLPVVHHNSPFSPSVPR